MGWFDDQGTPPPTDANARPLTPDETKLYQQNQRMGGQIGDPGMARPLTPEEANRYRQWKAGYEITPPGPEEGGLVGPQGGPTPSGSGGGSLESAIAAYQQANPYSPNAYEGLFDHLKQLGFKVERPTRAGGTKLSDDKIVGPDGKMYDITVGVDGPNPTWAAPQHIPGEYWFNGQRVQRPEEVAGGGWDPNGGGPLSSFGAPGLAAPWTQQFQAPTGTDDPGYAWRVMQGQKGIENSAAAKGTLLTGGTLKDIMDYQTGAALQGYGETWNRAKNLYDTNRGTWWGNQDSAYDKLSGMANTGANAAGNYATGMGNMITAGANANAAATGANAANQNATFGELAKTTAAILADREKKKKIEEAARRAGQIPATTPPYAPGTTIIDSNI